MKKTKQIPNGKFENLVPTGISSYESEGIGKTLKKMFKNRKERNPQEPIKTIKFNVEKFESMNEAFSWFGHSTLLLRIEGITIVSDPTFERASPFPFLGPKPFPMSKSLTLDDLPKKIDVLLLTHDHYDHLEKKTIKNIHKNVKKFLVPLKVKSILTKWGVPENKIKEFDWYDEINYNGIKFIFTPSRHFSGRGLTNRYKTLWGGWIIKSKNKKIYISGDTGYFDEFKKIGKKYGPFDITFLENGQYNKAWKNIHMTPEESVQAGIDLKSKILFPTHWGKYDLSIHHWTEPIERFRKEAIKKKQVIAIPLIGEIFKLDKLPNNIWWKI